MVYGPEVFENESTCNIVQDILRDRLKAPQEKESAFEEEDFKFSPQVEKIISQIYKIHSEKLLDLPLPTDEELLESFELTKETLEQLYLNQTDA